MVHLKRILSLGIALALPSGTIAHAKHAGLLKNLMKTGIVGVLKLKNAATNHEVTLLSEVHHDRRDPVVQQAELEQYKVVQSYFDNREQDAHAKSMHVMVEQPFAIVGDPHPSPSPARTVALLEHDPRYTKTSFENAEARTYSGGGYIAFNKDLSYFDTAKRIVVGGFEYLLDSLQIGDILQERMNLKQEVSSKANIFNTNQKSWVERVIDQSDTAAHDFERTVEQLGHTKQSSVIDVARVAQSKHLNDYTIDESFTHEGQEHVRPSLSHMTTTMIDPLYELYLYARIAQDRAKDQFVIAGTTHTALLSMMLKKDNYAVVKSSGINRPGVQPIMDAEIFKRSF